MTKLKDNKLFALFVAISSVIIVAGIILYALLGFNTMNDKLTGYRIDVNYNVMIGLGEKEDDLEKLCEDIFGTNGVKYAEKATLSSVDSSSMGESTDSVLTYTFSASADEAALAKAVSAINKAAETNTEFADAEVFARWHALEGERFYDPAWRGAIAIAVAVIVALAYITARYGLSCGVAGFVCAAHDALFTAALFAVTRIPVYAFAPVLYAAIAAFLSVVLWLILATRFKEGFKAGEKPAAELVPAAVKESKRALLFTALAFAVGIAVLSVGGAVLAILPALVSVAVPVYSALLIGPQVCIAVRTSFEKRAARKKGGYVGKKKAENQAE